jgi:hypothetical protein
LPRNARILDVGGTQDIWLRHYDKLPPGASITLLNTDDVAVSPGIDRTSGDARNLSCYKDNEFDLCFSNSLIEHFESFQEQELVAQEIRRVSRSYFVQTPNRYFPLEPHFLFPGWQFLPTWIRVQMIRRWDLGWMKKNADVVLAYKIAVSIRLLSKREVQALFPYGQVLREKVGPLTKSFVAYRASAQGPESHAFVS